MSSWIISQCCSLSRPLPTKPLPSTRPIAITHHPYRIELPNPTRPISPLGVISRSNPIAILGEEENNNDNGFDPGRPPPFGLAEIRAAIPKHCW